MSSVGKKPAYSLTRDQEIAASRFFGKHISGTKALVLFLAAILISVMPAILGIRFWDIIPETVQSGIRDAQGNDDSLPRAVLVYGIPLLFTVLTVICHAQLWIHQKLQKLPSTPIRLLGRWTMPIISLCLCSYFMYSAAGLELPSLFIVSLIAGVVLMLAGSARFDAKKGSLAEIKADYAQRNELTRKVAQRLDGGCYMAAGLLILITAMFFDGCPAAAAAVSVLLILLPPVIRKPICEKVPHI